MVNKSYIRTPKPDEQIKVCEMDAGIREHELSTTASGQEMERERMLGMLDICPRGNNKMVIIIFPCS